ncbi:MAG: 3-(methylthio)propionyl-CoA ligase [Burkholderiales bacterium]|nr:3-(methylthio)propionyl-CoA ligase [Burkholderiales bacterium]
MYVTGLMMQMPLLLSSILEHAERHHGKQEIVSRRTEGDVHRISFADTAARARKLANALTKIGVKPGENVATIAWNGYRHVEIYYAVAGMGAVTHTLNPRYSPQQLIYIINHAKNKTVLFDVTFAPLVKAISAHCPTVERWILLSDENKMPAEPPVANLLNYEALLADASDTYVWPQFDENTACTLCYTSGTTGNPKGVLYSHRSTILHAMAANCPDALGLSRKDTILPVVPMFHVNAWGLPYAALISGSKLVMPGAQLDGASIYQLMEEEKVTIAAGVPTIWLGLLNYVTQNKLSFSTFKRTLVGGAAMPISLIRAYDELGVDVMHGWGMTEMSPLGTVSKLAGDEYKLSKDEQYQLVAKQGRALFGVDMKTVDEALNELPWSGEESGELLVRGHWIVNHYYGDEGEKSFSSDATGKRWFATGDVSKIYPNGMMQITDRSKDVIKSGGEWISSIDLENIAMSHPAVQEAAVIAMPHEKWTERPLLIVVKKPNAEISRDELLKFYEGRIIKMYIPDDVVFVTELPHGATGKIQKSQLREQFKNHVMP